MKGNKTIHCEKCCGEITDRDDLIVTTNFLSIVPYHEKCFVKDVKGLSSIFVGNAPINGTMSNVSTILAVIFGVIVLFIEELRFISFVSLLVLYVRVYSWFKYERHL